MYGEESFNLEFVINTIIINVMSAEINILMFLFNLSFIKISHKLLKNITDC